MSQPQKLSDYIEFLPQDESRRPALPITNLPVNAISQEIDPTLEIRTLIEQLQQTAREARDQLRAVEKERDGLTLEAARSQQQIEALKATERELRLHFVEVTSLIQERDAALDESERRGQALAEAMRKNENAARERNDAQRQREDALRQRDELTRKSEALNRSIQEQARASVEAQKQLLAIRQARDGAHAQVFDLKAKLGTAEDQLAELAYQSDVTQKAGQQAAQELAELRRQLDAGSVEREATARQVEQLSTELDAQRQKYLGLAEQKSAALAADDEHLAALAETRAQVASLAAERDAARERATEQARELEEAREEFEAARHDTLRNADIALNAAHEKIAALETSSRASRDEAENLRQQLEAAAEQLAAAQTATVEAATQTGGAQQEIEALLEERDEALASLNAAQKQIDQVIRERDQVRQLATDDALEMEAQVHQLRTQVAAQEQASEQAAAGARELAHLQNRLETRRLESIDLGTQLQAALRQIRELSANLAEARLQLKFAKVASRNAAVGGQFSPGFPHLADDPSALEIPVDLATLAPASLASVHIEPLTEKEAKGALSAMRRCFQSFTKSPTDLSQLNELHCHVQSFAERARVSGFIALHRLCTSFCDLTRGLYENPDQVNPSTLRTVHQTLEFLGALMKEKNLAAIKDPAQALIYAVDDDLGNCECIALAMEESMMRTTYAQEPEIGLAEVAAGRYDLIFLDVNLPGMDGFELCRQIRALGMHATTPIVFLTGLATVENRVQSDLSGGNDFIAKPFNLHELSVKAMTLILKDQLQLA